MTRMSPRALPTDEVGRGFTPAVFLARCRRQQATALRRDGGSLRAHKRASILGNALSRLRIGKRTAMDLSVAVLF